MKINCPECQKPVKLSVEEMQKRQHSVTCPSCQKTIELKNNLPQSKSHK
jgi:endogenous inhibitor of DNA gyrase (YacG/DUF329 family)